jgi:hypothetical protein
VPTLLILHASQVVGDDLRRRGTAAPNLLTLYRYLYQFFHSTDCLSGSRFWATGAADAYVAVQYDEPRDRCHVARGPEPVRWIEYVDAVRSDGSRFVRAVAADDATCDGWHRTGLGTLVGGRTETRQRNTGPIPPATGRGPLVRHLNTPGTAEDFYREHQDLWRRIWEADTSGIPISRRSDRAPPPSAQALSRETFEQFARVVDQWTHEPASTILPSNRAITARPVEQTAPAPPPTYATLGEAVELDGPARSADDLDLHAERYRMIELD